MPWREAMEGDDKAEQLTLADASSRLNSGRVYQRQGDYESALNAYRSALRIQRTILRDEDCLKIANARHCVGAVLVRMADSSSASASRLKARDAGEGQSPQIDRHLREATEHLSHALQIRRDRLGDWHVDVADSAHQLGWGLMLLGETDEARTHLCEALETRSQVLGPESTQVEETLGLLVTIGRAKETGAIRNENPTTLPIEEQVKACLDPLGLATSLEHIAIARRYLQAAQIVRQAGTEHDPPRSVILTLAFELVAVPNPARRAIAEAAFDANLLRTVISAIAYRRTQWPDMLVVVGNVVTETKSLINASVAAGLVPCLLPLLEKADDGWSTLCPTGGNTLFAALWCIANIAAEDHWTSDTEFEVVLGPVRGVLRARMRELPVDATAPSQMYMCAFRALCTIPPASAGDEVAHDTAELRRAVPWLLAELSAALERKHAPGTKGFFPDAYVRLRVVAKLASTVEGRNVLVDGGILPLLAASLASEHHGNSSGTRKQWTHAVEALQALANAGVNVGDEALCGLLAIASGRGNLTRRVRVLAADAAIALGAKWEKERLLWLAVAKGDGAACPLSKLPPELIRAVMVWVMLFEADETPPPTLVHDPLINAELLEPPAIDEDK